MRKHLEYLIGAYGPSIARVVVPGLLWRAPVRGEKNILLTFDDGPTPHLTPLLLDILSDFDVRATFFLLGRQVDAYPELAREIVRRGHVTGVHGYAHLDAWKTSAAETADDLIHSLDSLTRQTGIRPQYYRPPYGRFTRRSLRLARELGLRVVMWGIMPGDYLPGVESSRIVSRVLRRLKSGSIVVLHDSANQNVRKQTAPALRSIVEMALNDGWSFETLSCKS